MRRLPRVSHHHTTTPNTTTNNNKHHAHSILWPIYGLPRSTAKVEMGSFYRGWLGQGHSYSAGLSSSCPFPVPPLYTPYLATTAVRTYVRA